MSLSKTLYPLLSTCSTLVHRKMSQHDRKIVDWDVKHQQKQNQPVVPGRVAQSVTCLVTDTKLTAEQGVASSIPARSHTFVEIDHEIISTVILLSSAE